MAEQKRRGRDFEEAKRAFKEKHRRVNRKGLEKSDRHREQRRALMQRLRDHKPYGLPTFDPASEECAVCRF
jgi:thioesterase domain-containing protein